jgi:hypothetical protein
MSGDAVSPAQAKPRLVPSNINQIQTPTLKLRPLSNMWTLLPILLGII